MADSLRILLALSCSRLLTGFVALSSVFKVTPIFEVKC